MTQAEKQYSKALGNLYSIEYNRYWIVNGAKEINIRVIPISLVKRGGWFCYQLQVLDRDKVSQYHKEHFEFSCKEFLKKATPIEE